MCNPEIKTAYSGQDAEKGSSITDEEYKLRDTLKLQVHLAYSSRKAQCHFHSQASGSSRTLVVPLTACAKRDVCIRSGCQLLTMTVTALGSFVDTGRLIQPASLGHAISWCIIVLSQLLVEQAPRLDGHSSKMLNRLVRTLSRLQF